MSVPAMSRMDLVFARRMMVPSGITDQTGADDSQALEQPCRYVTRPALANERVQTNAAGQVVLKLKTPWRDGTTHLVMSPLDFMQRWCQGHAYTSSVWCPRNFASRSQRTPASRTTACWHPTPSCARWWCRKGPSRQRRPHSPSNARRTAHITARCG